MEAYSVRRTADYIIVTPWTIPDIVITIVRMSPIVMHHIVWRQRMDAVSEVVMMMSEEMSWTIVRDEISMVRVLHRATISIVEIHAALRSAGRGHSGACRSTAAAATVYGRRLVASARGSRRAAAATLNAARRWSGRCSAAAA